jgi:hypothetical protein
MWRRVPGFMSTAVLALAALVVGHNLVFLLTYGPEFGFALARTGHGGRWDETVRAVLAAAALLSTAATLRLAYLYRLVRRLDRGVGIGWLSVRVYLRALLPLWARLFAISTLLFVLQENYEHWIAGLNLPGLGVLGSFALIGPILVFLIVSLLIAAVAALFRWGITTLEARIAATRTRLRPTSAPARKRLRADPLLPASSILGRNLAGRAPPGSLPA